MRGIEAYDLLMSCSAGSPGDRFEMHIIASGLALALDEKPSGEDLSEALGLDQPVLRDLIGTMFPGACERISCDASGPGCYRTDEEEQSLRDILLMYSSVDEPLAGVLAAIIARRCKSPHHLWQDLGLRDRTELSLLMQRYFPRLADKNQNDMKWKKFLYRLICGSEGFVFCAAPVCSDCDDFAQCFGSEDGLSRLARIAREADVNA
ncbi:nitrogen fixation protein NifQ [Methylocapsa palsarum]|uniref:Nitrogen fixation protein NifQ n=1 Tax=Methylocapsa palsarum TaxID=1612308 RepID=A0A1I3W3D2_9HYPH|nr:nitrogen fixation protein NifQ [Methylocapsa palsarum]SFK02124.1 nitrogen fixation protein NifQ [Methylocapsa palsarum]